MTTTTYEPMPEESGDVSGGAGATVYEPTPAEADGPASGADPRRRLTLPRSITDRYDYIEDISTSGAQADIIRCRDRGSGDEVAIKVYRGQIEGLDVEAIKTLSGAATQHVTPIRDFRHGEWTYEVQEYFPLGSLQDWFSRPDALPLSPEHVLDIVREIAAAVEHIHDKGILHRDLKPANVLIRREQPLDLVLADFGVARAQAVTRRVGSVAGTTAYMAPESTVRQSGRPGDWWALGLIIVEALSGRHLFADDRGGLLPDAQIIIQLNQWTYTVPDLGDARWTALAQGLLVQPEAHRFGGKEVGEWLAGGNPEVWGGQRQVRNVQPIVVAGRTCQTVADLADVARAEAGEVASLLGEPERQQERDRLASWLRAHEIATPDVEALVPGQVAGALPATVRTLRLQLVLDPTTPPSFRGVRLDDEGFRRQWRAALRDDQAAQEWIGGLRQEQVLSELASHTEGGTNLAVADDLLRRWWNRIKRTPAANNRPEVKGVAGPLEGHLLGAAFDPSMRSKQDKVSSQVLRDRRDLPRWAAELATAAVEAPGDDGFGLRTLASLIVPDAQRMERGRLVAERDAARAARRAQIARDARRNAWAGLRRWALAGLPVAFLATLGATIGFSSAIPRSLIVGWAVVLAIGTVVGVFLPRFNTAASCVLLAAGTILAVPDISRAMELEQHVSGPWERLTWGFLVAGLGGHLGGLLPIRRAVVGRGATAASALAAGGLGLSTVVLMSLGVTLGIGSAAAMGPAPFEVLESLGPVGPWVLRIVELQPSWAVPHGLWTAFVATSVTLVLLPSMPRLPHAVVSLARALSGLWGLFVAVGNFGLLIAPVIILGSAVLGIAVVALIMWVALAMASS